MESGICQCLFDFHDLEVISGFQTDFQEAAGDGHICVTAVVVNADNISAAGGDDLADLLKLSGLILQCNHQISVSSAHDQTSGDDA